MTMRIWNNTPADPEPGYGCWKSGAAGVYYAEARWHSWAPSHDRQPLVEAPTAALVFDKDVMKMPRKWADSDYNLKRWNVMLRRGHFVPMETPDVLIEDLIPDGFGSDSR
jgi:hypothetical protein